MATAPRVKLISRNYTLRGTWTCTTQAAGLPVANLNSPNRQLVWRSASPPIVTEVVQVDLGQAEVVEGFALVGSNVQNGAQVVCQGASDAGMTDAVNFSWLFITSQPTGVIVGYFTAPSPALRYWRILLNDPSNPAGYVQAGVVVLGPVLDLAAGPQSLTYTPVDPSLVSYAISGTPYAYRLPPYITLEVPLGTMTREYAFSIFQPRIKGMGTSRDVVLSIYGAAPEEDALALYTNLYGRLSSLPSLRYQAGQVERFTATLAFRESL